MRLPIIPVISCKQMQKFCCLCSRRHWSTSVPPGAWKFGVDLYPQARCIPRQRELMGNTSAILMENQARQQREEQEESMEREHHTWSYSETSCSMFSCIWLLHLYKSRFPHRWISASSTFSLSIRNYYLFSFDENFCFLSIADWFISFCCDLPVSACYQLERIMS